MIQAFGYEWRTKQPWGRYHPDNLKAWYSTQSVIAPSQDNNLILKTRPSMHTIDGHNIPYACGLITSTYEDFGYGTYEIVAKLPKGRELWPAFWLTPINESPPEIDIFEAETKKSNGYLRFNPIKMWNVKSNFHYGENYTWDHQELGAKHSCMGWKNPANNFISYKLVWTPYKIEIFYNGILNRSIIKHELLEPFRDKRMMVIINNIVTKHHTGDKSSEMEIRSFKYDRI